MNNRALAALIAIVLGTSFLQVSAPAADVVTDWNVTLNDAIIATPSKHNPGNPTRAMAMMNAAIYDVFQAVNRTHAPFKINVHAPGADINAAVAQAAYRVISDTYSEQQAMLDSVLASRLGPGPYSPAETAGIALGNQIGQYYVNVHANDGHNLPDAYTPTDAPFHWSSDPLVLPAVQKGWGADWGFVTPWAMPNPDHFDSLLGIPDPNSQEYVDAFNQVKDYGALNSPSRIQDQTDIGVFWAYDRPNLPGKPGVGPPPVLFVENMIDIAEQVGNSPAENARMFATASVSMADAAIAAWDAKYEYDFWRPITAIRADANHDDDNPATVEDPTWVYLGAPGFDPNDTTDDFTPPFPAYTSGHATMGGAIFKALELFYGTNDFSVADAAFGADPLSLDYTLYSNEPNSGGPRDYVRFTQVAPLTVGTEDSPEGENGMSRVYLGVHWLFDQQHGIALGNAIAEYAGGHYFRAIPEPASLSIALLGVIGWVSLRNR
ncbi:MAG: vanadium-dependent haloperoxidase [Bythopirellula sp.]|nr:vanadium-dependent haloperoxidase [Bythopirellula sp.]